MVVVCRGAEAGRADLAAGRRVFVAARGKGGHEHPGGTRYWERCSTGLCVLRGCISKQSQ